MGVGGRVGVGVGGVGGGVGVGVGGVGGGVGVGAGTPDALICPDLDSPCSKHKEGSQGKTPDGIVLFPEVIKPSVRLTGLGVGTVRRAYMSTASSPIHSGENHERR